jgi:gamma-glutamylaminecyclotransferase
MYKYIANEKIMRAVDAVFVYGTLKKGFSNHHLLSCAKFIGTAVTEKHYALYEAGLPYVISGEQVSTIHGEVYLVDQVTLAILDNLEGHPNFYKREQVHVCLQTNKSYSEKIIVWIYFYPKPTGQLKVDGIFK